MSQEKSAEIIDLNVTRTVAASDEKAGDFLANARRAAGLDLSAVSAATKIKLEHLQAIECSDAAALPAAPYAIGFVKVYAAYLGLDAADVANKFKEEIRAVDPAPGADHPDRPDERNLSGNDGVRIVSMIGIAAVVMFAVWIGVQITGNGRQDLTTRSAAAPGVRMTGNIAPAPQPRRVDPLPAPAESALPENIAPPADEAAAAPVVTDESATLGDETATVASPVSAPVEGSDGQELEPATAQSTLTQELRAPVLEEAEVVAPTVTGTADPAVIEEPARNNPAPPPQPVIREAQLVRSVPPRYPARCDHGAQDFENVSVLFDVTPAGAVQNTRIASSSNACFEEAALSAVARWRFSPKTMDGVVQADLGKKATLNFQR